MRADYRSIYEILRQIYQKHRRKYQRNKDTLQMCCMWPTDDPPDIIEGTHPFDDIENAFCISVDDDTAMDAA